jgi:hypothetical protein
MQTRLLETVFEDYLIPIFGRFYNIQIYSGEDVAVLSDLIEKYPLPTKACTSGFICSIGDALTQNSNNILTKLSKTNLSIGKETWTFS